MGIMFPAEHIQQGSSYIAREPVLRPLETDAEFVHHLHVASRLIAQGRAMEALVLVESLAVVRPHCAEVLRLRGQCLEAGGNIPGAYACYSLAVTLDPSSSESTACLASLFRAKGMLPEAMAAYTRALELAPNNKALKEQLAVVLTDMGTRLKAAGDVAGGMAKYSQAIELNPGYSPAHYNLGVVFNEMGQYDVALNHYRAAVAADVRNAQALCNIGVIAKERGDLAGAVAAYEAALAAAPNWSILRSNMAIALTDMGTQAKNEGRLSDAIALYERALYYQPRYSDALYNLGVACGEAGAPRRAALMYELALAFNPRCAEALNNLGVLHKEADNMEAAASCYIAALAVQPNFPQSLNNLGVLYTAQGRAQEALALLAAAITSCPTYAEAHNNLGVLQRDVGEVAQSIASYSRCLELQPGSRNAGQNRLLALNYLHPGEEAMVCKAHEDWGVEFQRQFTPLTPRGPALDPDLPSDLSSSERQSASVEETQVQSMEGLDKKEPNSDGTGEPSSSKVQRRKLLRVGYISPDLFTHSVSYFVEAPFRHHRRSHVEFYVYSCVVRPDAKTLLLRAAVESSGGVWREVAALSETQLAASVRADCIDILVELTGHTANNRLGTMAMRPAPVQATWVGYPNTTGLEAVRYRMTDAVVDPLDTQQTFIEELVRLPDCFLCYTPPPAPPAVAPLPALSAGYVTFGSFNALAKVTPQVLRTWAAILSAVPRARLLLKAKPFTCAAARGHVLAQLANCGVPSWRVDLLPLQPGTADHLATYHNMDISLDPYPYAGTTTTCESLFMGVPVLTLRGRCHSHNVGVSLMSAVGLSSEWVADTEEEYVALAVQHASDLQSLATLRAGLRERMTSSKLCDGPRFVAQLEAAYLDMWQRQYDERRPAKAPRISASAARVSSALQVLESKVTASGGTDDSASTQLQVPDGAQASRGEHTSMRSKLENVPVASTSGRVQESAVSPQGKNLDFLAALAKTHIIQSMSGHIPQLATASYSFSSAPSTCPLPMQENLSSSQSMSTSTHSSLSAALQTLKTVTTASVGSAMSLQCSSMRSVVTESPQPANGCGPSTSNHFHPAASLLSRQSLPGHSHGMLQSSTQVQPSQHVFGQEGPLGTSSSSIEESIHGAQRTTAALAHAVIETSMTSLTHDNVQQHNYAQSAGPTGVTAFLLYGSSPVGLSCSERAQTKGSGQHPSFGSFPIQGSPSGGLPGSEHAQNKSNGAHPSFGPAFADESRCGASRTHSGSYCNSVDTQSVDMKSSLRTYAAHSEPGDFEQIGSPKPVSNSPALPAMDGLPPYNLTSPQSTSVHPATAARAVPIPAIAGQRSLDSLCGSHSVKHACETLGAQSLDSKSSPGMNGSGSWLQQCSQEPQSPVQKAAGSMLAAINCNGPAGTGRRGFGISAGCDGGSPPSPLFSPH